MTATGLNESTLQDTHSIEEQSLTAFDAAAPVYDAAYESLRGIKHARTVVTALYRKYFSPPERLLELNCGTGTDAIALARLGIRVLATDASPMMIEQVRLKIDREGLGHMIATRTIPFSRLDSLSGETFDGSYSNLGGLNCTGDLSIVASALGRLVRPGGVFIATVMPPFCLWETASFLARFNLPGAMRRLKPGGHAAHYHGGVVQTYYYSYRKFTSAFSPWFRATEVVGLNILTPPPNFDRTYTVLGRALPTLERLDDLIARYPPFSRIGDHYIAVLRRRQMDVP